jgi:hypothetical protein
MANYDWNYSFITPHLWGFNLYQRLGTDKTKDVVLIWGKDIEGEPQYTEDEQDMCNACWAIGGGQTWDDRPKVYYEDLQSILVYGLHEDTVEFDDVTSLDTLHTHAVNEVQTRNKPRRTLKLDINNSRGYFASIREGDIVSAYIPEYGFSGLYVPIKVLGREMNEENEVITLAAEIVERRTSNGFDMQNNYIWGSDAS